MNPAGSRFIASALMLIAAIPAASHAEYELVWADEFEGDGIDERNWEHQVFPGVDSGNNELQYYTARPVNSRIEDGCLLIEAHKERYKEHDYTSARLRTMNKRDFLYGKIEARIKLPSGRGMWPAFWMMPADSEYGTWAASGEIDIMEALNEKPDHIMGTLIYGGKWPHQKYSGKEYPLPGVPRDRDFAEDFHIYTLEWQPYEMRWYVDGNLYLVHNEWYTTNAPYPAPFDKKFHIILNVAVGGNLPKAPDDTTPFPLRMYVDWVRVYQTGNKPPRLRILQPESDVDLPSGSPVVIEAEASDPDGNLEKVSFYNGEKLLGEVKEAPYRFEWSAPDGFYTLRVKAIDAMGFAHAQSIDVLQGGAAPQKPYGGKPAKLPGKIEAENFDEGAPGQAYHDTDKVNQGGLYRQNVQVDIQLCGEGGYDIGWMEDGEWVEYTVTVPESGEYDIRFRVATPTGAGRFHLEADGLDKTGTLAAPNTGDWQKYASVTAAKIALEAGEQVLRFVVEKGGMNLDYIEISRAQ